MKQWLIQKKKGGYQIVSVGKDKLKSFLLENRDSVLRDAAGNLLFKDSLADLLRSFAELNVSVLGASLAERKKKRHRNKAR